MGGSKLGHKLALRGRQLSPQQAEQQAGLQQRRRPRRQQLLAHGGCLSQPLRRLCRHRLVLLRLLLRLLLRRAGGVLQLQSEHQRRKARGLCDDSSPQSHEALHHHRSIPRLYSQVQQRAAVLLAKRCRQQLGQPRGRHRFQQLPGQRLVPAAGVGPCDVWALGV